MKHLLLICCAVASVGAQSPVRVSGVAYDSLHGKPLSGAFIGVAKTSLTTISDSLGRFTFAAVPPGEQHFVMQHDVLDALGLSAAGTRARVTDGKAPVIVAVPSFATLWRAACGITPPGADTGFVFGSVSRAGRLVPGANVAVSWIDLFQDSTRAVRQKQKVLEVDADSTGNFAACGVPTSTGLSIRATVEAANGVWQEIPPLDKERIARKDLSIVATVTPASSSAATQRPASFSGKVELSGTRAPVDLAEVMIPELGLRTMTNARGEFKFAEVVPGSHKVQVRKIGYSFPEERLEFEAATSTNHTLLVQRMTTLDSVAVVAKTAFAADEAMQLFEEHRKIGLGKFLTRAQLETNRDRRMIDLLAQYGGFKAQTGSGGQGWLLSNRGTTQLEPPCQVPKQDHQENSPRARGGAAAPPPCRTACFPHVFLDGVDISPSEVPNINRLNVDQIEAIEIYTGAARVPPEYNQLNKGSCGVIVLHSRRGRD